MRHPVSFYAALLRKLSEQATNKSQGRDIALAFFRYIINENDVKSLGKILRSYIRSERKIRKVCAAELYLARLEDDTPALRNSLEAALSSAYGGLLFEVKLRPELVQGFRLVLDKRLALDASISDLTNSLFTK